MKIYLVGGAVRDKLLGIPVKERDWVVIGATPEDMLAKGYIQVGKDFPVFLHPKTKEEYALARTERKTGPGYKGFKFSTTDVTLEEDLKRRDLTINAIAEDESGVLIDPYGGQKDIEKRVLRHISNAFSEDPVRILRVARFAARYNHFGFKIADETNKLMQDMVEQGEVDSLVAERVWQEIEKALSEEAPIRFFETLKECRADKKLFPPETNNKNSEVALNIASELSSDPSVRFAAWIFHSSEENIKLICEQLRVPKDYQTLALLTFEHQALFECCTTKTPRIILEFLKSVDAFRRPERFEKFLLAAEAVSRSLPNRENWPHPQREYLHTALISTININARDLTKVRLEGKALAEELDMHRRAAISKIKRTYRWAKF